MKVLEMTQWADGLPRDTDPISRSMFGHLLKSLNNCTEDSLIVIPVVGDSSRKMDYLLKQRRHIDRNWIIMHHGSMSQWRRWQS